MGYYMKSSRLIHILKNIATRTGKDENIYITDGFNLLPIRHVFLIDQVDDCGKLQQKIAVSSRDVLVACEELKSV